MSLTWPALTRLESEELVLEIARRVLQLARSGRARLAVCAERVEPADGYLISRELKLFFPVFGATDIAHPAGTFRIGSGCIGILPPRFPHREQRLCRRGHYAHLFVSLAADGLSQNVLLLEHGTGRVVGQGRRRSGQAGLLREVAADLATRAASGRGAGSLLRAGTHYLVQGLVDLLESAPPWRESPLISRCRALVDAELTEQGLTVARIAEELRVHPDHLSREFHRQAGVRLKAWIQQQRLRLAQELLQHGRLNVNEVARLCGFSDHAYFSRVYRDFARISPSVERLRRGDALLRPTFQAEATIPG